MKSMTIMGLLAGGVMVVGGGLWWVFTHAGTAPSTHPRASGSPQKSPHPSPRGKSPGASVAPQSPNHSTSAVPRLGTVAWATRLRQAVSQQWGTSAPPLWAAADPAKPGDWLIAAPLAHAGALWWGLATPTDPLPKLQAVAVNFRGSQAAVTALPAPLMVAYGQAEDLVTRTPWNLTHQMPPLGAAFTMDWQQTGAQGTTKDPLGWSLSWTGAVPQVQPAALLAKTVLPWTPWHGPAELISEGAQWLNGTPPHIQSLGVVNILANGRTQTPLPATDTTVLVPTSVAQGLSTPTRPTY